MKAEDIRKFTGRGAKRNPNVEVNRNDKPTFIAPGIESPLLADIGEQLSVDLKSNDPEGFGTRYYLWSGQGGTIEDDVFRYLPKPTDRGKTKTFRLICSDGTGAYRGLTLKIIGR